MERAITSTASRGSWRVLVLASALFAPLSVRAQECFEDSDCEAGFQCDDGCEPVELSCATDDDCPSGATCQLGHSGEPASEGQCVLTLTECSEDSECGDGELCTVLSKKGGCTGVGSGEPPSCGDCPRPPPEPETNCSPVTTVSYCFAPLTGCMGGEACAGGTRCVTLAESVQEDLPSGWPAALCLPELWALALERRIELEGIAWSGHDDVRATRSEPLTNTAEEASDDGSGAENESCAVRAPGSRSAHATWPSLACAAWVLVRRTRRRRAHRTRAPASSVSG